MFGVSEERESKPKDPDEVRRALEAFRAQHMAATQSEAAPATSPTGESSAPATEEPAVTASDVPPAQPLPPEGVYEDAADDEDDSEYEVAVPPQPTDAQSSQTGGAANTQTAPTDGANHAVHTFSTASEDSSATAPPSTAASRPPGLPSGAGPSSPTVAGPVAMKSYSVPGAQHMRAATAAAEQAAIASGKDPSQTSLYYDPHGEPSPGASTMPNITGAAHDHPVGTPIYRGVSDGAAMQGGPAVAGSGIPKRVASTGDVGRDIVVDRASVPYSEVFPLRDEQVGPHHFRILKLLGRGGIGRVFLVQLKGTSLLYAMKVLTKEEMIQRNKIKRVMTEREILATANHPFVVTMYASFQTSDRLCFVMEYCAGGEFFKVLQKQPQRRLKEADVRFYAAEVTLALEYLHHKGFIYRDLKPENILLRANGHIALTDFDLSKQAHAVSPRIIQQQLSMSARVRQALSMKRSSSSLNTLEIVDSEPILPYQTNSFVGTEDYISPEIINGVGQSSSVDWWTLGILIYEMLTGTTPFKGAHTDETFNNIVSTQLKWPDDVSVSPECKQVVKKLLRREPEKRLGAVNGATDIKRARWFQGFNFALVRNATPPIIPKIRDPLDFSQYTGVPGDEFAVSSTPGQSSDLYQSNPNDPFDGFDLRRDSEIVQRKY